MTDKIRLDVALTERGLAESRERAKAVIMAGTVFVNNQKSDKPGTPIRPDDRIEVRGGEMPFVSRGGYKLEKAMKTFSLDLHGLVCADIGASTGGFTDCMLQNGAQRVYAVDVGYGQLAWKLRNDPRVVNLERCNFRYADKTQIPELLDFASVDVSFISLRLILPVLAGFLKDNALAVCLVKPQFEAGREKIGKHGVVHDPNVHEEVLRTICDALPASGFSLIGLDYSPIKGPQGNIEYLACIRKTERYILPDDGVYRAVVDESHCKLDAKEDE